jgi:hypothetical protein
MDAQQLVESRRTTALGRVPELTENSGNKIRQINIREVNRGYIVEVGCHTFVFETKENLLIKLSQYIDNPQETEKQWSEGNLF